ncbi:MAG: MOSC domain-containing protein [Burkholderiaceae bacterium]
MQLVSVNVAQAGDLFLRPVEDMRDDPLADLRRIPTAIRKRAVDGPVAVRRLGLTGDEQADLSVHGGLDKAVYAYPVEHYPFWTAQRAAARHAAPLVHGALGENLTLAGLTEEHVWIGDRLRVGSALLEVTEPRQPCYKFNAVMGFPHASKQMLQAGCTGFYLKVVEEGEVRAGDALALTPGPREVSLASVNAWRFRGRQRELF